jgi:hypothetical protein
MEYGIILLDNLIDAQSRPKKAPPEKSGFAKPKDLTPEPGKPG